MRIPVIISVLVLVCSGPAGAQGLAIGVRGGVNLADVALDADGAAPSFDSRIGLVAGAFVTLPITSWIELQPEVLYSGKGARLEQEGIESKLVLDYLEVPVLARVSGNAFGTTRYYVVAGPTAGFRMRAKTRTEFSGATEELDISEDVERFDFGIAAGGGLQFGSLLVDARYTFGLTDIDKDTTDSVTIKNRVLSLTAGIRF